MAPRRESRARARTSVVPFPRPWRAVRPAGLLPSARSLVAGALLLVLALGGYAAARTTSAFALREVEVDGATPALAREVRAALTPFAGESLLALDVGGVLDAVEAIPDVRAAWLERQFPHTLVVGVERELPTAVLRQGRDSWLVSDRGRVLRRVPRGGHPRLPRLWLPAGVALERGGIVPSPDVVRGAAAAAALAPGGLPSRVRTIRVGPGELTLLLASGRELRLGDESEIQLKLAVAAQILPSLAPLANGGPAYLDVDVPERPVAGPKPQVEG